MQQDLIFTSRSCVFFSLFLILSKLKPVQKRKSYCKILTPKDYSDNVGNLIKAMPPTAVITTHQKDRVQILVTSLI